MNVCQDHLDKSNRDHGSQVPFLCKNLEGFHNLSKLSSKANLDGFYYVPRVDKKLIKSYNKGLIALTGSIYGDIPNLILNLEKNMLKKNLYGGWIHLEMIFMSKLIAIIWKKKNMSTRF